MFGSSESTDKQITIVSTRGAPHGVTYSVNGTLNYEFTGGPDLKPDLPNQENETSQTDLDAALRVQEYLEHQVGVSTVLTSAEYVQFVHEVYHSLFDRSRHSRYAGLGMIMPFLRTAARYLPQMISAG